MNDQEVLTVDVQNETPRTVDNKTGKERKSQRVLDSKTDLYFFYDRRDNLIYIGISKSAIGRFLQHKETSSWFDEVKYIRIEKFKTRSSAKREEERLIKLCVPKYNVVHGPAVTRIRRKLIRHYGSLDAWSAQFDKKG